VRVRHGNDAKLFVGEVTILDTPKADPQLIILLRDAHRARALALAKPTWSLDQLADRFGRSSERFKRLIRMSYLSPGIVAAIIEARQPAHLTGRFFQHLDGLPMSWAEQEQLLLA
jgi:AraC-like DNA-binding protein